MFKIDFLKTTSFGWAKHIEHLIKSEEVHINNSQTGLPKSSFYLEDGIYSLIVSKNKVTHMKEHYSSFYGLPILSGTEEENTFLEEIEDDHKRIHYLTNGKLVVNLSQDILIENDCFNQEIFVYLFKD